MKFIVKCILLYFLISIFSNAAADETAIKQPSLNVSPNNISLPSQSSIKNENAEQFPQRNKDTLVIALRNDIPPMSFQNLDGNPTGMFVDIWRLWGKKTGQKIEFLSGSFKDSMEAFNDGHADVFMALTFSEERSRDMVFSQPIYEFNLHLFFLKNETKALGMTDLKGQKLGLIGGTHLEEELRQNYPEIEIVPFISIEEMIRAIREGKIRAFLSTPATASMKLNQMGVINEITYSESIFFVRKVHVGILKENKNLLTLVDKGFDRLSIEELGEIEKQWVENPDKRYFNTPSLDGKKIRFTTAEEAWLKTHRTVSIGIPADFSPLIFTGDNKRIQGIIPDYLDLFSSMIGIHFQPVILSRDGFPEPLSSRNADVVSTLTETPPNGNMELTDAWFTLNWVIVNRLGDPLFRGIQDLTGKKVAVVRNTPNIDLLKRNFPGIDFYLVGSPMDAMQSVSIGNADAFIGTFADAAYVIQGTQFSNLKIAGCANCEDFSYKFSVRNDWPELVSILNKVIHTVTTQEQDQIFHKWIPVHFEHFIAWQNTMKWIIGIGGLLGIFAGMIIFWNRKLIKEIGNRVKAESALRDSERKFQYLYNLLHLMCDNVPDLIWAKDLNKHYIFANKAHWYGLLGATDSNEPLGKNDLFFAERERNRHPNNSEWHTFGEICMESDSVVMARKQVERFEEYGNVKGQFLFLDVHKAPFFDQQGNMIGTVGCGRDITLEKQAKEHLKIAEEKYRAIFENSVVGVYQTSEEGKVLTANPALAKMFGYDSPEDFIYSISDIGNQLYVNKEIRSNCLRMLREKGSVHNIEAEMLRKDGSTVWISITGRAIHDLSGKFMYYEGFLEDISHRKYAEDALKISLAEKEILLKEVHHRVKNNLMAIMGLVDMQGKTLDIAPAKTALAELGTRIKSMALVHEQLYQSVDFSRIDFQNYLEALVAHLHTSYGELGGVCVNVNANGIEMGLDNAVPCGLLITELVTNAYKYAFPGGKGRTDSLSCKITISVEWDGVDYTLTVADNGIGLPADVDWRSTESMGLLLVRMLGVHQLQGRIEIDQTNGTMFRLRFSPIRNHQS